MGGISKNAVSLHFVGFIQTSLDHNLPREFALSVGRVTAIVSALSGARLNNANGSVRSSSMWLSTWRVVSYEWERSQNLTAADKGGY